MTTTDAIDIEAVIPFKIMEGKRTKWVLRGVPGGPPNEGGGEGLVIVAEDPVWPKGVPHEVSEGGQKFLRDWTTERFFVGSQRWPEGLEIGMTRHYTDPETGQPFIERSDLHVTPDTFIRLQAFANNEPYFSLTERRRLAKESARFQMEKSAGRSSTPGTKTPTDVMQDLVDARMEERIAKMVEDRVNKVLDAMTAAAPKA